MGFTRTDDSEWEKELQQLEAADSSNNTGNSDNGEWLKAFNDIQWCEITKTYKPLRLLGRLPRSIEAVSEPTDPTSVVMFKLLGDDKKMHRVVLPVLSADTSNHLLYKVAKKVLDFEWVDDPAAGKKKKFYKHAEAQPEIYNWCTTGGATGKAQKFNKGLETSPVTIMNVIDRSDNWCVENKHTKLIAKSSSKFTPNGSTEEVTRYEPGMSEFVLLSLTKEITKAYGNWERYDVALKKTGLTNPAAYMKNVSVYKEKDFWLDLGAEATDDLKAKTVVGPLTDAELEYDRYDIHKFFGATSYQTILKHFKGWLGKVDAAFGTEFVAQAISLANQEKQDFAKKQDQNLTEAVQTQAAPQAAPQATPTEPKQPVGLADSSRMETPVTQEPIQESVAPSRRTAAPTTEAPTAEAPTVNTAYLKGWESLTADQKAAIVANKVENNATVSISYNTSANLASSLPCDTCGVEFPENWTVCPACGTKYAFD